MLAAGCWMLASGYWLLQIDINSYNAFGSETLTGMLQIYVRK